MNKPSTKTQICENKNYCRTNQAAKGKEIHKGKTSVADGFVLEVSSTDFLH